MSANWQFSSNRMHFTVAESQLTSHNLDNIG